jgi:predicted phage baseplate assembly protein
MVPTQAPVRIRYQVTAGEQGNLPAGQTWTIPEVISCFGKNDDPMTGGAAELTLLELRRLARESVRKSHAVVTQTDLEQAALALCDLQVARAQALPLPDPGSQCLALPYRRSLVVLRMRAPGTTDTETPQWLTEIRRLLSPRLPLGERLKVMAPQYGVLAIRAVLTVWPTLDSETIRLRALAELARFFALIATSDTSDAVWPLGRGVEMLDVKARLRSVAGVRAVADCELLWQTSAGTAPVFSRSFLPLWDRDRTQIWVKRMAPGG